LFCAKVHIATETFIEKSDAARHRIFSFYAFIGQYAAFLRGKATKMLLNFIF